MHFIIFLVLTCGQVTDTTLLHVESGKYWQGSMPQISRVYNKEAGEGAEVMVIKTENSTGQCT